MTRPLGFTGSQTGMTPAQYYTFAGLLDSLRPTSFHQGCCIGADDEATTLFASHATVRMLTGEKPRLIGYPSDIAAKTSQSALAWCDEVMPAKPPRHIFLILPSGEVIEVNVPVTLGEKK